MGIYGLVGIFEILSAQSDCTLSQILYIWVRVSVFLFFSHPSFTGLFVVHLIACKIFPLIEPIVTVWKLF